MRFDEVVASSLANQIFAKFNNDKQIKWIDTDDLLKMAAEKPTAMSPEEYTELWASLTTNGMETPLVVTQSKTHMRLDSGNHRVRLFKKHGIKKVPVVLRQVNNVVQSPKNGLHTGIRIPREK